MSNFDDVLFRKAYVEAGRALALYVICFNLGERDKELSSNFQVESPVESPTEKISLLLRYSPRIAGLSMENERTDHWEEVTYFWGPSSKSF